MKKWQTKEQLTDLLCSIVQYQSVTGSTAEIAVAEYIHHILSQKEYFQQHTSHLNLHPLEDGRRLLTAFVRGKQQNKETVILLSHFDVVGIEDYGSLRNLAFHPKELTEELYQAKEQLPDHVKKDLEKGEWLFGRGTMDMKAGLTLHLSMLERAIAGEFEGNLLLLSVPDEEVNSSGMLTALPVLNQLRENHDIEYSACLNSEPMFSKYPGDPDHYIYTGSIGKVLPGFYCYGKESHVGEPFAGINPNLMISFLSQQMELNEAFIEQLDDEITPPPVSLMQRDLKAEYSVQTPQAAITMYNVLYLKQSFKELNRKLLESANQAAKQTEAFVKHKAEHFSSVAKDFTMPASKVNVFMYEELYQEAVARFGQEEITRRQNLLVNNREQGDRDFSTLLVQELAGMCKDLAPMIVLFYSPPFYPAVSSHYDPYIQHVIEDIKHYTNQNFNIELVNAAFFTGLSDLSFVGPVTSSSRINQLTTNMPLQHNGFDFPEDIMEQLTMPILNIGPLGKDPHQWTERLELNYSFTYLPDILARSIDQLLTGSPKRQ
ncbi:M20/M25/M40 family metallo-hydrolase [Oceanobacillus kapialis]|uniref:M20/M25/M40 family metallo-hydrolase n=1 Tax=Oceanobacillus kapialis TaxID=481353 RepID=A0ABW5Q538_9BACI